jgi:hypothetical protein
MEISDGELRRIRSGPTGEEIGLRPFLVRVHFTADDPAEMTTRAGDVLAPVIRGSAPGRPTGSGRGFRRRGSSSGAHRAGDDGPEKGWIDVATTGWPFGTGSLYWLIEASGGDVRH